MYILIAFVLGIVLMIVSISKWKVHPFLAIMGVSLLLAFALRIPLNDIPGLIGTGFSSVFTSIGLVIILGALIGAILEKTGAAVKIGDSVVKIVGKKHPELAMLILGFIVSIPVFCDSGFVITNPIRKAMQKKTGASAVAMTVCLSAGLYCSHVFIPPTPGPIAAAGSLGIENQLILIVAMGALISIPCLSAAYFYAKWIGKRVKSDEEEASRLTQDDIYSLNPDMKLPGGWDSIAPIIMPLVLMAVGSFAPKVLILAFLGKPLIALTVGLLFALVLLIKNKPKEDFRSITENTLRIAGPILFITAAGSVLGKVIMAAGLVEYISTFSEHITAIGIFFPFIMAAILKTAQGSSTVAIITTSAIMGMYNDSASLMNVLGLNTPMLAVLTVLAIGAGAMTVSHANDSYFWVVTRFGGIKPDDGYKTQTAVTGIMGIVAIMIIALISTFACTASCTNYHRLRSGDLVFCYGEGDEMELAISKATGVDKQKSYNHVGIILVEGDSTFVLEALPKSGVCRTPIELFLARANKDNGKPAVDVMRVALDPASMDASIARAKELLGRKYDFL